MQQTELVQGGGRLNHKYKYQYRSTDQVSSVAVSPCMKAVGTRQQRQPDSWAYWMAGIADLIVTFESPERWSHLGHKSGSEHLCRHFDIDKNRPTNLWGPQIKLIPPKKREGTCPCGGRWVCSSIRASPSNNAGFIAKGTVSGQFLKGNSEEIHPGLARKQPRRDF